MSRSTIDFGIDLGTTNSAIAVLASGDTEVFKNNEGFEYTPSAVWIDKNQRLFTGKRAKERAESDARNTASEFKLLMGTDAEITFQHSGRRMRPEELSAEVLKSLRDDVKQRTGEDLRHAVITVPAAFEFPQCEATRKAAQLAGLETAPLLQEPVAAAMAYGFEKSESDKVYWLVYDFGGGTFDAALMHVREGIIQVANHGGDNQLGGKLVDWEIVERLLIPAVVREHNLPDFRRGNERWLSAIAKLKQQAEQAKIRLSRDESAGIFVETLCLNDAGDPVSFEFELQRRDLLALLDPYVRRSINICKRVLSERNLSPADVDRLVLVGGPTLTPRLRELLADPKDGLGIKLDFSIDPLTIVARGAAIFAGTQRIEGIARQAAAAGHFGLELKYKPVGTDLEPQVGGRLLAPGGGAADFSAYTIEFVHPAMRPPWRSGKIRLSAAGTFFTTLVAARGVQNTYAIEVADPAGSRLATQPDSLTYTIGLAINEQPLIHSLGIALAENKVAWLIRKGAGLPARKRDEQPRRTVVALPAGRADAPPVRIVVIEGDKDRADRNKFIGALEVHSKQIRRDLPLGSEIEISLEIDASRLIRAKAFIPILDEEFELKLAFRGESPDPIELAAEFASEKARLEKLRARALERNESNGLGLLQRVGEERVIEDIAGALAAARTDPNACVQGQNRILDLRNLLDEVEDALEWPTLVSDTEDQIGYADRRLKRQIGGPEEARAFAVLEREARQAMGSGQPEALRLKLQQITELGNRLRWLDPDFWVARFEWIRSERGDRLNDPKQGAELIAQGLRFLGSNDLPGLRQTVNQLTTLLPDEDPTDIREEFRTNIV